MKVVTKEHEGWFVRIWADPTYSTLVRYEVLEIHGWEPDGSPLFQCKGTEFNDHLTTTDHGAAEVAIFGEIKWDGCSHNYLAAAPGEPAYIHACGRHRLVALGEVWAYLYDEAQRLFAEAGEHCEGLD